MIRSVTEQDVRDGLRLLGLNESPAVIVHSSLKSFGRVEGGALTVCRALVSVCRTVLMPAFTDHLTSLRTAPPGLERPDNAYRMAPSWEAFDAALARAVGFSTDLPIDPEIGVVPETLRREVAHVRSLHPMLSFIAVGEHAADLVGAARLYWPLGPIEVLARLGGSVLLLGVGHDRNTAIHLAEQQLGRSRFWRYAKAAEGVWMELPNIPGESDRFTDIESELSEVTSEVRIGLCRARRVAVRDVLATATQMIRADPAALLSASADAESRAAAALRQRLATLSAH